MSFAKGSPPETRYSPDWRANASTQFKDGTCESLKNGSQVEAKGTRQTDGSVLATSVEGDDENENDDQENEVELEGAIVAGSIGGACASHSLSFKIGSTTVRTNAATEFKDVSCASLKAGDSVEVKGARQSDASVMASPSRASTSFEQTTLEWRLDWSGIGR